MFLRTILWSQNVQLLNEKNMCLSVISSITAKQKNLPKHPISVLIPSFLPGIVVVVQIRNKEQSLFHLV